MQRLLALGSIIARRGPKSAWLSWVQCLASLRRELGRPVVIDSEECGVRGEAAGSSSSTTSVVVTRACAHGAAHAAGPGE
uniref:Uncharacterized protein n=1 Tax=Oryza barthii TaxID=65489 RepID=A0A0D3HNB2_9ORYZ